MTRKCHVRFVGRERTVKSLATRFSLLEAKETVEPDILDQVAKVLKINTDALKDFDEESVIHNINTFYDHSAFNFQCTINPIEKWMEAMEENKRLYEALLKSEREKITMLEKVLAEEKKIDKS